ncbi:MAG: IS1182 family transposase [Acidobacteria bacterium]|nr:IS1182 family transposase [Acidobacteriota bacterium]
MSKQFRFYDLNQPLLLPPSFNDWLPEGHLARFLNEVVDELDLSAIYQSYEKDGRGQAAYHPGMMVRLLLYGYCIGVVSSRAIERATYEEVAFRYLSGDQHPDHDTIAEFRQRHLQSLAGLFKQALQLCQRAGLVKLGHVALDGTKVKANASKHKAMSYERMGETEQRLEAEVTKLLEAAEQRDEQEDAQYGKGRRGDELPVELARRESRLRKIREAKAALEAEAKERAAAEKAAAEAKIAARRQQEADTGQKAKGRDPQVPDPAEAQPDAKAQRNFTDPDSRIMRDGASKSFEQAYNAQAAVDSQAQVIVAAEVTQQANDKQQLVPMLEKVAENMGQMPEKASADAGYFSEANVTDEKLKAVDLHVPPDRQKHGEQVPEVSGPPAAGKTVIEQMREKLKTAAGREVYKRRKAVVEPVFGQIKEVRGFRRFSFRGKVKVRAEWLLICLTHNLLKLFRANVCLKTA